MCLKWCFLLLLTSISLFTLGQVQPVHAELTDKKSFSMIVFPDIQTYVKFDVNQPLLDLMTAWTANNLDRLNVKTVLCTGDLVDHNEKRVADGRTANQTSEQQWTAASKSFSKLDHKIAYVVCTGNHDYGYEKAENRSSRFHHYFPAEKNECWAKTLLTVGKNEDGIPTLENAAYHFESDTWGKLLVLSLEFAPRDATIEWAKGVARRYKEHRVILLTHSYLDGSGGLIQKEAYKMEDVNYGQAIWDKLVKTSPNICFVVCGHWAKSNIGNEEGSVSFRVAENEAGKNVPQMMFNAQTAGKTWHGNGGDGWLRILEFMPNGKTVKVKTFSPLFAISHLTADKAWRTAPYDEFEFTIAK